MADFFEWDAGKFALNIPQIDDEHRQIIEAMNNLHQLWAGQQARARSAEALGRLLKVTVKHFQDEEVYMEKIAYPDLVKHKHVHKHLLERLEVFAAEFRTKGVLTEEFFQFLKMWLKSHICGIDTQYARHAHAA